MNKEVIEGGCWLFVCHPDHYKPHCLSDDPSYSESFTEVLATNKDDGFFAAIISREDDESRQPTPAKQTPKKQKPKANPNTKPSQSKQQPKKGKKPKKK